MYAPLKTLLLAVGAIALFGTSAIAQTTSLEGTVKGEDGQPVKGAIVHIERTDIKGKYDVKTDKKGHYGHYGLPLGTFNISVEVDGKIRDAVKGFRSKLGDPSVQNFDLKATAEQSAALQKAAESGTLTKEQSRSMSPEQKKALEEQLKQREQALAKNKALQDAYNDGKAALEQKNYEQAIASFQKASELDPSQVVIWQSMADAYTGLANSKPGSESDAARLKGLDAWKKTLELKPDDAAYYNNYALALAKAKKFDEMSAALDKAAQLDPANAGKYYFNLGAVLTNAGQAEAAGQAFKKAITLNPDYADAQYQYGIYLLAKAQVAADGKVTPVPGTVEAFQKYLELQPNGPNAESAKGMLASMSAAVSTKYVNPDAKKTPAKKK